MVGPPATAGGTDFDPTLFLTLEAKQFGYGKSIDGLEVDAIQTNAFHNSPMRRIHTYGTKPNEHRPGPGNTRRNCFPGHASPRPVR